MVQRVDNTMSIKSIPRWQYRKTLRHDITLYKTTMTTIGDDEYDQKTETYQSYSIKAEVQPITLNELKDMPPGLMNLGDAWGYFLPSYYIQGQTITVEPEDEILCETIRYEVVKVEDHYQGNSIVWRRCYLRRISGED